MPLLAWSVYNIGWWAVVMYCPLAYSSYYQSFFTIAIWLLWYFIMIYDYVWSKLVIWLILHIYFKSFNIFQVYQYFTIFFYLNNFHDYLMQHSLKSAGTKDHFRQVKVPDTAWPLLKGLMYVMPIWWILDIWMSNVLYELFIFINQLFMRDM